MSQIVATGISIGAFLPTILSLCGISIGQDGVDYYAEVHTTLLNSYCHTIGMPFTIYGMLLWIPMLFNPSYQKYIDIQNLLYTSYMTHYILLNYKIGGITAVVYAVPLYYAQKKIKHTFYYIEDKYLERSEYVYEYARITLFVKGLIISAAALIFQEGAGHWLSGDPTSRLNAIPNAMLYAMYYSIYHIF